VTEIWKKDQLEHMRSFQLAKKDQTNLGDVVKIKM